MVWESVSIENFVEITRVKKDGSISLGYQKYTPRRHSISISTHLRDDDAEIIIRPYALERFIYYFELGYPDAVVKGLIADVSDERTIAQLGMSLYKREVDGTADRYFMVDFYRFKNNKPDNFDPQVEHRDMPD